MWRIRLVSLARGAAGGVLLGVDALAGFEDGEAFLDEGGLVGGAEFGEGEAVIDFAFTSPGDGLVLQLDLVALAKVGYEVVVLALDGVVDAIAGAVEGHGETIDARLGRAGLAFVAFGIVGLGVTGRRGGGRVFRLWDFGEVGRVARAGAGIGLQGLEGILGAGGGAAAAVAIAGAQQDDEGEKKQ